MQSIVFKLPDLGEGVVEAEIVAWHVEPGQEVRVDQPLVDVMTDKATVTIPSGLVGRVSRIHGNVGETVAVGAELVSFDTSALAAESRDSRRAADREASIQNGAACLPLSMSSNAMPPLVQQAISPGDVPQITPQASPAVRRRARELHVDLQQVQGSGPNGRITHGDVDVHLRTEVSPISGPRRTIGSHTTEIQMVGMRRRIAEKMVVSNTQIPHFSYIEEVDITELEALREHLNSNRTDGQPKLTYLPFIMLSVTRALARFPELNAHYDVKREVITRYEAVHLGIATQTDRGLCVPVVRHTETMDLWQAARDMRRITEAARNHSISRDDLADSTFTITSLGRHGGIAATPIINHPEVGILGINKAIDRPVVRQGQIAIRRILNLSASFDHRVVDGADGAIFIQCVKDFLEYPATIFI
ncbi:MAG TPA: dihydrolipoamide acetyltransferase family protein [Lacipirellulaceae bacterium]|jgi:2-oxoisovalerate dehydrogenase E2 component (dihydrolipoyl transacylase)|nr:dihydrolipoamide acetyltransferase family protein [Lacipirellulaceae bacterium]